MAKKRKANGLDGARHSTLELDPRSSRKDIRTFEDVADSDDEFHLNRDEVRLGEEPDAKRRRKWAEEEEFLEQSDEEVLGDTDSDQDLTDELDIASDVRIANAVGTSEDDDVAVSRAEEEAEYGWGTSKGDLYGADIIETEEQAREEELEALRLQKKQLESMSTADYGSFEDDGRQEKENLKGLARKESRAVVTEILPQLRITPDMGTAERLKILKARYPEFEPLSKDLLQIQEERMRLQIVEKSSAVALMKSRAASAYLGALTMYFSLLTSTASRHNDTVGPMPPSQLRDHHVMASVLKCRELWTTIADLPEAVEVVDEPTRVVLDAEQGNHDSTISSSKNIGDVKPVRTQDKSRAQRYADAARFAAKERQTECLRKTEADLADLDDLVAPYTVRGNRSGKTGKAVMLAPEGDHDDLGEESTLTAREAEDKAKRKKSLRFYTSQIAQKANKRGLAGRNAGGDDDIPHRERLKDRQARLNAEAEKRGKKDSNAADLGDESDEEDHRQARHIRENADDDDEYYDLIAARTSKKKADKAALAEAQRQAAMQGGQLVQEEIVGADGKRKISYAIEKNKGLTPHRKKDVRNPRVKKRKKFDEKKKKLASIKPVYKGGEGRGGYGGELTGIKKGLVKSRKL